MPSGLISYVQLVMIACVLRKPTGKPVGLRSTVEHVETYCESSLRTGIIIGD